MIKILICCLGGFSSSAMVTKVKNEIKENGLQDKIEIEFSPLENSYKIMEDYNVVMVCPHIKYILPEFVKKYGHLGIPMYVLPPRMYGNMKAEDLYEDAMDIIEGYKESKMNPWYFKGEEDILRVRRDSSYRKCK